MAPRAAVAKITDADGNVYEGEWTEGKPHGRGTKTWVDGDVYEGEWKDGCHHGRGFFIFADGDVYDGEWKDNMYDGTGTFTWADGDVYSGEWKGGLEHGRGTKTWANVNMFEGKQRWSPGDLYEGEWVKGLRHGHGTRRNASGDVVYEGKWVEGFPVEKRREEKASGDTRSAGSDMAVSAATLGSNASALRMETATNSNKEQHTAKEQIRGDASSEHTTMRFSDHQQTTYYANGEAYEGELKEGKKHGRGVFRYANGDVCVAEWRDDKQHGNGVCRFVSGIVYDGEWKDGVWHGWGTFTSSGGDKYEGEWVEGERHGRGTVAWTNGDVYKGEFVEGMPHGRGTRSFANGDINIYHGEWKNGKMHGMGTLKCTTGDVYEGEFADGKMHGKMTWKDPEGGIYEQIWANGQQTKGRSNFSLSFCSPSLALGGLPSVPIAGAQANGTLPTSAHDHSGRVCGLPEKVYNERTLRSAESQQRRLQTAKKETCEHCGVDDGQYKLRVCSGCNLALYCSAACQKAARNSHQRICDIISDLPPRDGDRLRLEYDKGKQNDFDAGLRYATKYMGNLKHLHVNLEKMASGDALKLSPKQLSSLLKSKRGALDSVFWVPNLSSIIEVPGITKNGHAVWKELRDLKQLRLQCMKFDDAQHICDIIGQQKDTLMALCLPYLEIGWHKAKSRRTMAQAVGSCKHLVTLDLTGCVLMDSDLKVMLHDLPSLRIISMKRHTENRHEFTDNTCGLIARKCPGLQELNLFYHDHLSVKGIRKIFEGCSHLRAFYTTIRKLSCKDIQSLLEIAPQLLYFSLNAAIGRNEGELSQIVEATGGRTVFRLSGDSYFVPDGVSTEAREKYESQIYLLERTIRHCDLLEEVANEWADMLEG